MKTNLLQIALLATLLVMAASPESAAQAVPPQGYWTVETNERTKNFTLVKFYDDTDQLVYEERLAGVHLDVQRRRTAKLLNQTLQCILGKSLVMNQLKNQPAVAAVFSKKQG